MILDGEVAEVIEASATTALANADCDHGKAVELFKALMDEDENLKDQLCALVISSVHREIIWNSGRTA